MQKWKHNHTKEPDQDKTPGEKSELIHRRLFDSLSAGIVHEINNPLYGITNYIELLSAELETESQKKHLEMISQGINMIKTISGSLLNLSQTGKLDLEPGDINTLLKEAAALSLPPAEESKVDISIQVQENIPHLTVDKNKIKQVFLNLILNAVEAMPNGGSLEITAKLADNNVSITFHDTGCGIPEDKLKHIFEPFYSGKKKNGKPGVGLGLFMAELIVSSHHGKINVTSPNEEGNGSTFEVILPVTTT